MHLPPDIIPLEDFFKGQMPLTGVVRLPESGHMQSVCVIAHGSGSNGVDAIGIGRAWAHALPDTLFIAPSTHESCRDQPDARSWFPLLYCMNTTDSTALEQGRLEREEGTRQVAPVFSQFLDTVIEKTGIPSRRIALFGFSQGTMVSLHVALRYTHPLAGLVGYSGWMCLPNSLPRDLVHQIPIYLIHGQEDNAVPVHLMHQTVQALIHAGLDPKWHVRPGLGHDIDDVGSQIGLDHIKTCLYQS